MSDSSAALTSHSPVGAKQKAVLDIAAIRKDFPILARPVHGHRLVYLDNAATTQKPQAMIDALTGYYSKYNANVHRGVHTLAEEATAAFESTRGRVGELIGETNTSQIIFTRNTTEALNLVAASWGGKNLKEGDEILLTQMEHHSNLVPWMMVARKTGAVIKHIPVTPDGKLNLSTLDELITSKTKVVSLVHISNVLGTINPVAEIAARAKAVGALVVVDGAQSVPHMPVNVPDLNVDFYAFSAHKMLGPTGVGVLWGNLEQLEAMDPYMGGGEMIRDVRLDGATWNDLPWKFEAGTPNIADVVAFGAAIDYLLHIGMDNVRRHEIELTEYAMARLAPLDYITMYGSEFASDRAGVITFNDGDIHPHDLSTILDHHGVAVRAAHHCAQPLMRILGTVATARASFYVYDDIDDIDQLIVALKEARKYFGFGNGSA
jgi:cysteine desulfurase/selenocysteine lyase